ncbi:MAG TPA: PQQ-binding-like beta-propeller repeat protein, partial [Humisphaera sp.]|nr:PQQ-binding-like beta-propeller repeat protein [Humisphaera sp.]
GEWPQWRGPHRDDVSGETGLLKQWPAAGPPLAWKTTQMGEGFSSVSVADGHIYTLGSSGGSTFLIALDLNGKHLWKTRIGSGDVGSGSRPGPRATPTVDGDRVYAMDEMGNLACLMTADGKEVWRFNMQRELGGRVMSGWGFAESVLIDGDKLLCTPGGTQGSVAALNKMTGKVIWRCKQLTEPTTYASLVPADFGGTHQYVVLLPDHVAGVGTDGSLLWQATRHGVTAIIPTPIVHDNLVYVTSGYGVGCNCFRISGSGSAFKAQQLYANNDMVVHHGGVVQLGGYVYGFSDVHRGVLTCMDLKTGKVVWTDRSVLRDSGNGNKASLTCAEGKLYVRSEGSENGAPCTIGLIEATPAGYHELGKFNQPDRSQKAAWSHPVVADGKLFLRDQDVLLCYDIKQK